MNTIERIEKVFAALQAVKDAGGARVSANIDDVSLADMLAICEHYGLEPSRGTWWSVGVHKDDAQVMVFSERIGPDYPKPSSLQQLRMDVAKQTSNAAA